MKKRNITIIFMLFLFLIFPLHLASVTTINTVNISSHGMVEYPILRVQGKQIVNSNGRQVLLRGFSLWDTDIFFNNLPLTVSEFQRIKNWGFNAICPTVWWSQIERNYAQPGIYDEARLTKLDNVVQNAGEAGLYVIIRLRVQSHEPKGDWEAFLDDPNQPTADYVLTSEGLTRFSNLIEMIVHRYDSLDYVIGYNPWHFPWHNRWSGDFTAEKQGYYNTITPAMINAIRDHSTKIIFWSPFHHGIGQWSAELGTVVDTEEFNHITPVNDPLNNVVYMHDGHRPWDVDVEGSSWDGNVDYIRGMFQPAFDFSDTYNVPMCLAEFSLCIHGAGAIGVRPIDPSRLDMIDAKLQLLDVHGDYNWLFWIYTTDGPKDGVLEADGSPSDVVSVLQAHTP